MRTRTEAALALLVLAAGCGGPPPAPPPAPPADLSAAEARFLEGDLDGAEAGFSLAAAAGSAEASGWLGAVRLKQGKPLEAEQAFRQALAGTLAPESRARARSGLADCLLAQGRPSSALAEYQALLDDPEACARLDPADLAFHAGLAALRCGQWEAGAAHLRRVANGKGPLADRARERLEDAAARRFAVQLGAFASEEGAERMIRRLLASGVAARREPVRRGDARLHAVRVGRYESYAEAQAEALRLRALGEEGVVVP